MNRHCNYAISILFYPALILAFVILLFIPVPEELTLPGYHTLLVAAAVVLWTREVLPM